LKISRRGKLGGKGVVKERWERGCNSRLDGKNKRKVKFEGQKKKEGK
jgi:hypothetical protein